MASHINRVLLTGNLCLDPVMRAGEEQTSVCRLRLASNSRRMNADRVWVDRANYFDVVVFGAQAEVCGKFLEKGRGIAVDGRLSWSEWVDGEGKRRQSVQVIADTVQFLPRRPPVEAAQGGAEGAGGAAEASGANGADGAGSAVGATGAAGAGAVAGPAGAVMATDEGPQEPPAGHPAWETPPAAAPAAPDPPLASLA